MLRGITHYLLCVGCTVHYTDIIRFVYVVFCFVVCPGASLSLYVVPVCLGCVWYVERDMRYAVCDVLLGPPLPSHLKLKVHTAPFFLWMLIRVE